MIKREKIQSIILSDNGDFRRRAVESLNILAFPSIKLYSSSIEEALTLVREKKEVQNIIIDNSMINQSSLKEQLKKLIFIAIQMSLKIVFFTNYPEVYQIPLTKEVKKNFIIVKKPINIKDIKKFFSDDLTSVMNSINRKNHHKQKIPSTSSVIMDASEHIRITLIDLNKLSKKKSCLDLILKIGQKFNSLMGGFTFIKKKDGYEQLHDLSVVIDGISRTYEKMDNFQEISDEHFKLLLSAAKCSYKVLQYLRKNKKLPDQIKIYSKDLFERYHRQDELIKRKNTKQEEVDLLFDQHH